jgi:hypothetical protein
MAEGGDFSFFGMTLSALGALSCGGICYIQIKNIIKNYNSIKKSSDQIEYLNNHPMPESVNQAIGRL